MQEYEDISEVRRNGQELGGSKLNLDLEDSHCENEERHQCSLKIFEEYISFLGMYSKRAECVPESIETLQQECCIEMEDACLKYSPTGMYCKVEDQKNPTCKEPHPLAKRAECVPESIETLQQECSI
ncbi:hypothetical protein TNCT_697271 [Trichonephila clavata]|uniref:Uncharacterized protein n=1 Tax=Trichonephila clavata TaxID=2740835 RepID=A0A8X6JM76_TRICU|nr:hypothetical protein TNCT_697271 [Trichonephila clavata]